MKSFGSDSRRDDFEKDHLLRRGQLVVFQVDVLLLGCIGGRAGRRWGSIISLLQCPVVPALSYESAEGCARGSATHPDKLVKVLAR